MPSFNEKSFKQRYDLGEFPTCYKPYLPFWHICKNGIEALEELYYKHSRTHSEQERLFRCLRCIEKYEFEESELRGGD